MTFEIEAGAALKMLGSPKGSAIAESMVGCLFYTDDADAKRAVSEIDVKAARISIDGERPRPYAYFQKGYFVDERLGSPLEAAIDGATTPTDRELAAVRKALCAWNIKSDGMCDEHVRIFCAALESELPAHSTRQDVLEILSLHQQTLPAIEIAKTWIRFAIAGSNPCFDVVIELTKLQRHSGLLKEALASSQIANLGTSRPQPGQRSVLATQQAAMLIDHYESGSSRQLLGDARRCLNQAWAIQPSEHVSSAYHRLRRFE